MSKIVWRDDIANALKDQRLLMIATPVVPGHVDTLPEMIVAHWYEGNEGRSGARLELIPIYWADLCELPSGVTLLRLDDADFKG
jgi:hypothetical protein